jgi:hypothetical protein
MVKVGNEDCTFPIGKSGRWRRVGILGITDPATEVTAEYFATPYASLTPLSDSLTQVSSVCPETLVFHQSKYKSNA